MHYSPSGAEFEADLRFVNAYDFIFSQCSAPELPPEPTENNELPQSSTANQVVEGATAVPAPPTENPKPKEEVSQAEESNKVEFYLEEEEEKSEDSTKTKEDLANNPIYGQNTSSAIEPPPEIPPFPSESAISTALKEFKQESKGNNMIHQ